MANKLLWSYPNSYDYYFLTSWLHQPIISAFDYSLQTFLSLTDHKVTLIYILLCPQVTNYYRQVTYWPIRHYQTGAVTESTNHGANPELSTNMRWLMLPSLSLIIVSAVLIKPRFAILLILIRRNGFWFHSFEYLRYLLCMLNEPRAKSCYFYSNIVCVPNLCGSWKLFHSLHYSLMLAM